MVPLAFDQQPQFLSELRSCLPDVCRFAARDSTLKRLPTRQSADVQPCGLRKHFAQQTS